MYITAAHGESSIPALRQLIRDNALGILTTGVPSDTHAFLQSSHIPFVLDVADESSDSELGTLRGHMARQNPQSKAIIDALQAKAAAAPAAQPADGPAPPGVLEQEVLVLFTAAPHHYITPKWYTATKPATGKVVPTWNYAAAQVYGRLKVYYDSKSPESVAFLDRALRSLTDQCEGSVMGYSTDGKDSSKEKSWEVDDAPEPYVRLKQKNIIGIEIEITRLEGKFKMSQESVAGDVKGVAEGLGKFATPVSKEVGGLVCSRNKEKLQA
ncbi:transcriptional regulator PAI 2-type [Microdochium bolleyi]|uniref:Transcriptional regulator PAI 2-type n=1 Tax=Microdochium bolleyi TaxID=196109 RepID=A0A136ITJ1_9PEZI|nr:transcriptional regulator PAI 2-type [Microdochium bolleyi]